MSDRIPADRVSDRRAFLRAIQADPDDDAPRLVMADWLDDNGEHDRAELIRVQCELARLPEAPPVYETASFGIDSNMRVVAETPVGVTAEPPSPGRLVYLRTGRDGRLGRACVRVVDAYIEPEAGGRFVRTLSILGTWEAEGDPNAPNRDRLTGRECALLRVVPTFLRWPTPVGGPLNVPLRRGFFEAESDLGSWLTHGPSVSRCEDPPVLVTLTDRRPSPLGLPVSGWGWFPLGASVYEHHCLIPPVYESLRGEKTFTPDDDCYKRYPTEAAALADASRALLVWAELSEVVPYLAGIRAHWRDDGDDGRIA